jgi:nucleoside phosphorylase
MAPGTRWLLVGALEAETSPIISRLQNPTPAATSAGWDHVATWGSANGEIRQPVEFISGSLDGVPVSVLVVGVGPANAERYTRYALEAMHPEIPAGVVSFGTCGSLVDSLQAGDVVTATALLVEGTDETKQRLQMQPLGNLRQVAMATCKIPVRCAPSRQNTLLHVPHLRCKGVDSLA